ncbi:MAG: hypothetical protein Q4C01_06560 [Clostridia bacterium]|nr:hypothetical protein [Clostridia bacterium]
MKRLLTVLLATLLLCGCGGGANEAKAPSEPAKSNPPEQTELIDTSEPTTETATPTSEPMESATAEPTDTAEPDPQQPVAFSASAFSNEPYAASLPTVTTLVKALPSASDEDGIVLHEMWNQELDFQGFCLALDEFNIDESGAVLRFTVTLPDAWTDEVKEAMRDNGLRFRIYLDETETDAFRTRTVSELEGNGYTIQYSSCVLPIRDWQSVGKISVVPDVINTSEVRTFASPFSYDLENGETASYYSLGTDYSLSWDDSELNGLDGITYEHTLLSELALSFTVNENPIEAEPVVWEERPVVLYEELFEENEADGFYDRDYDHADAPKAQVSLTSKTFEGVTFTLTHLCLKETGPEIELHLQLPDSWTDKEVLSFYSPQTGVQISVTAVDKNGRELSGVISPSVLNLWSGPSIDNYLTENFRDVYFRTGISSLTYENWKNIDRIIIVLEYAVFTHLGYDADSVPLSEEPITSSEWLNILTRSVIRLDELAITIDIDETIFDAGL